ncbi:hypothetical protein A0H81_07757 [Grifola frondosa]|uniref:BHLH domain-containing protein n=1 Tax=Grifola frondosa TaxID=5627 RepID=A0A1C7M7J6_GRIFR|nr:hypothetical protein A0H81_07757 [Grifola frondosa]
MSLLTPSESLAFSTFLSSVDLEGSIEWDGSVNSQLAEQIPHAQGREALTKATKDLMSLDTGASSNHTVSPAAPSTARTPSAAPSFWPSFNPEPPLASGQQKYGLSPTVRPSSRSFSNPFAPPADGLAIPPPPRPTVSIFSSAYSQSQANAPIPPIRSLSSSSASSSAFTLPPLSTSLPPDIGAHSGTPPHSATSIFHQHSSSSIPKRPLPSALTSDPSSSKRPRPTPTPASHPSSPPSRSRTAPATKPRRPLSTAPQDKSVQPTPSKPALLSPSQKRANHIQSEQKRRANIRRGYEALCEAVPALREAIRMEEEREREREMEEERVDAKGRGKGRERGRRRRSKGDDGEKPDGRAGPRSENVVLQKTIDYVNALLSDHHALMARLEFARGALTQGHPALLVASKILDERGVPLWEREWNGGSGIADDADEAGGSDEEM